MSLRACALRRRPTSSPENTRLMHIANDDYIKYGAKFNRIEIAWCGICGSDRHRYERELNRGPQAPFTMGHEFSGIVREVGSEVRGIEAGDRVVVNPLIVCHRCHACRRGYPNLCRNIVLYGCGPAPDGAFAEYTQVPDYTVIKIPDSLPLDPTVCLEWVDGPSLSGSWERRRNAGVWPCRGIRLGAAGFTICNSAFSGFLIEKTIPPRIIHGYRIHRDAAACASAAPADFSRSTPRKPLLAGFLPLGPFGNDGETRASGHASERIGAAARVYDLSLRY